MLIYCDVKPCGELATHQEVDTAFIHMCALTMTPKGKKAVKKTEIGYFKTEDSADYMFWSTYCLQAVPWQPATTSVNTRFP